MANVASVLKTEISRVARKEIRAETEALRKALLAQKGQLSALRKEVADLAKALKAAQKSMQSKASNSPAVETSVDGADTGVQRRFSASRLLAHRQKLGLSVAAYAALVGVSSPTLRGWELGRSRPSEAQLERVVAARNAKPAESA